MLVHLHVKNLALIEEIEVEFSQGLNILTGETGAGKSILLGSMQLILGGKTSREMVRRGASYGLAELLFQVENPKAEEALRALDIELEEGQVLLSRRITDGRSICRINGETCTLTQMKKAASCLLHIHGQHEHQSLLYREKQLEILDEYGGSSLREEKEKVRDAFRYYQSCREERKALDMDEEQRKREMAFLEFEAGEITEAGLVPGEDEELEKRYKKLSNGKRIISALQGVYGRTGYEQGAGDQIGNALTEFSRVTEYDEELEELFGNLSQIDSLLNDFNRELSSYMEDMVFDEEVFYETERRLDLVNNLKAKYGKSIEEILNYRDSCLEKLEKLEQYEENRKKAEENCRKAEKHLLEVSEVLSELRRKNAENLEKEIIAGLQDLNFLDVRFRIRFDKKKNFSPDGTDDIEYEISTNPGEELHPLGRIVSGGELSRIMLAIKTILADRDQIETLLFDEIDTGISGRTAQKVSEKMAQIGRHRQVLCITHLPQIAAMADTHFEIEKHGDENGTITQIHPLSREDSVRELARLLGGARITEAVLENAAEMKELADARKKTANLT